MPVAIVLASVIIATGFYFSAGSRPGPAPVATEPAPALAPAPAPDREQVARHASAALAYQRSVLLARCYLPAIATMVSAIPAEFTLDVTFDAQGTQIMRGLVEHAGTPEITRCVGDTLTPLLIPPPGAPVMVEIALRFP